MILRYGAGSALLRTAISPVLCVAIVGGTLLLLSLILPSRLDAAITVIAIMNSGFIYKPHKRKEHSSTLIYLADGLRLRRVISETSAIVPDPLNQDIAISAIGKHGSSNWQ